MGRDRAAYMRSYRARTQAKAIAIEPTNVTEVRLRQRIGELEAEVRQLKRELASRPAPSFNSRPFTPVPKPGKG